MLRIHIIDEPFSTTLKIEGKLIQEWATEARNTWLKIAESSNGKKTIIDLHDLSFADDLGRNLLSEMHKRGARLVGSGPMVDALIEEITLNGNGRKKRTDTLMKTILSVLFLLLTTVLFGEEPPNAREELTLDRAISLAVANNRQVRIARLQVDQSDLQVQLAKIKRLPTLNTEISASGLLAPISFTFDKGSLGNSPVGPLPSEDAKITNDPTFNVFGTASLTQPLSQLYRIGIAVKANKLSAQVERENLRAQRLDTINKVRAAYYEVLRLQSAITANAVSIKACQELDRLIKTYAAEQTVLRSDALEVKTRLLAEQEKGVSLRDGLQAEKEQMNLLLGRDLATDFEVASVNEAEYVEMDLVQSRARAFDQRPELKQAMLSVQQAEYNRKLKKSEYIPDVTAYVSYVSPFSINFVPKNMATAGVQVKWEPFDWGRKRLEVQDRQLVVDQSQQKVEETRSQIALEVGIKFRKLEESRLHLQVTQVNQETEQEKTRVMVVKYSEKAALLRDVLDHQSKLAEANHEYQHALLSYWTAKADFARAIGEE
jgi:outer membrane protein TolC